MHKYGTAAAFKFVRETDFVGRLQQPGPSVL